MGASIMHEKRCEFSWWKDNKENDNRNDKKKTEMTSGIN